MDELLQRVGDLMPVTEQDARALAHLAKRIHDETPGARRWDTAGIEAETAKLVGQSIAVAAARVIAHAADPDAATPGAIRRPFTPHAETDTQPHPPRPNEACRLCGRHVDRCLCDRPTTRRTQPTDPTPHAAAARAALRATTRGDADE